MIPEFPLKGPTAAGFFATGCGLAYWAIESSPFAWFSGAAFVLFVLLGPVRWITRRATAIFEAEGVLGRRFDHEWANWKRNSNRRLLNIEVGGLILTMILIFIGLLSIVSQSD